MRNFSIEKKGYKKEEVGAYVLEVERKIDFLTENNAKLTSEIEKLKNKLSEYLQNEDIIKKAIEVAIKTGKEIEQNSKKLYVNEIKNIKSLYEKWNNFLNNIKINKVFIPETEKNLILKSLNSAIEDVLKIKTDYNYAESKKDIVQKTIVSNQKSGAKDEFRNIIFRSENDTKNSINEFSDEYFKELERLKSINRAETENNNEVAFSVDNKFNLAEAVKATMSLEDIMKSINNKN